jgi:hypothetical protein
MSYSEFADIYTFPAARRLRGDRQMRKRLDTPTSASPLNVTIQISKTGSDANDGVTAPIATFARLQEVLAALDLAGQNVVIELGAGTWNETLEVPNVLSARTITIRGQGTSTVIDKGGTGSGIYVGNQTDTYISDISLQNTDTGITVDGCNSGYINRVTIINSHHGVSCIEGWVRVNGVTFGGQFASMFHAYGNGYIYIDGVVTYLNSTYASTANAYAYIGGIIVVYATASFVGSVTGRRYYVYPLSQINVGGRGENLFPGTVAGFVSTNGFYG